jgi:3-hydroxybutyryl-CoA dehydrogenase
MKVVSAEAIRRVTVVGAGTMGHGIAQVAALALCEVRLFDAVPQAAEAALPKVKASLETAVARGKVTSEAMGSALARLSPSATLEEAAGGADLVIEAIPEKLEWKQDLFARLGAICAPEALLASNTSSLSLTRIAARTAAPERVVGLHFFNPPPVMKLLEVVRAEQTSEAALQSALGFAARLGKEAIVVKDSPGFATSRLGVALGLEAMRMLQEGVATAADIDKAMELGYGHPMGPLRVSDLVGLDVRLAIAQTLATELSDGRFEPPEILREKVREGKLGKKSGEGFYRWGS